ncbi:hypothetical protein DY000_02016511 [Brassica cretica]|uniref:At2g35280-like TPR domain-containing protein n=1 Tax=Brassica cretica TaxID=69181 RepID=A0ABQ7CPU2_BRACR|nr:hypothetical protein DY000_02016511 [Brassica cretica]
MEYFPLLELSEEIQALVVERVARNSFQDLYGLKASSKSMKALAERRGVYHCYDVLSVPWEFNMPSSLLKSCYAEGNPRTLYIKGVQLFFSFGLKEEGISLMKRATDTGYEGVVYTHAMTRAIFWCDGQYFVGIPRESVQRIGKLVRSVKWGWGVWHSDEFHQHRVMFISAYLPSFYSCQCATHVERQCLCLWHIDVTKDDNMCERCF